MADWRDKIRNPSCDLCPLHESAEHVCLMGDGKRTAEVMIVGEAPGAREDAEHRAFVGKAGKLLDTMLTEYAGLQRKDVYITNVAKCRPPHNRTPDRKEVKTCVENYLLREIKSVKPRWLLTLGNSALRGVVGRSGITKHRGSMWQLDDLTVMASFHPAFVLRTPRYGPTLAADIARFGRMTRGEETSPQTKIQIIRNSRQLKWLLQELRDAPAYAYDIETNGFQEYRDNSRIICIAFTWREGQAAFLPLWHDHTPWRQPYQVLRRLAPYLEDPKAKHVAHNGKFDARWLARYNIHVPQTFDTMLAAHMLDENRLKGLKPLSQILLGADAYDLGDDIVDADGIPLKRLARYNGKDTDYTFRLYHILKGDLRQEPRTARVFAKLMMPASNALVEVERRGIQVDWDRWGERSAQVHANCAKLEKAMLRAIPKDKRERFNFNSSQQVSQWLFDDLGLDIIERTAKGMASSKESVLKQLAPEHRAVELLLKWRKWNKYRTTYIGPWAQWVDNDMRIHPTYKLSGTVTGRLSCVDPNLQQVPREPFIRSILTAKAGHAFVQADYSQIELRIAAMLAHEKKMLRLFAQGADIHLNKACELTGKLPADVTKEERKLAKAVNFGFLYSMGAEKFVSYALDNYGIRMSFDEAVRARESFFESYPALPHWHDRQRRLARRYGRVVSPLGRTRHLPDIVSDSEEMRREAERQAINSPVQSTASDLMLLSLVLLQRQGVRIVGTVHDSLLFEVPDSELASQLQLIRDTMENLPVKRMFGADLTVPIKVDIEVGTHWAEGEEWNDD